MMTTRRTLSTLLYITCLLLMTADSFLLPRRPQLLHASVQRTTSPLSMSTNTEQQANNKATLTEETAWKLRFVLRNVATESGKKVDELFVVSGRFVEEEGYEPPQGSFVQDTTGSDEDNETSSSTKLKITKSRWQLSEDPNDRKDGLWIWGLFKEPLYPYMLLQLETDAVSIAAGKDRIPPLQLYAQINHKRSGGDNNNGAVQLEGADLKIRQVETIKADPFGAAKVDIFEEVSVGNLSIQLVA